MSRCWRPFIFLILLSNADSLNLATCRTMLGMQNGAIPDAALSASSSREEDLGPQRARIRSLKNEKNGNAWCPKEEVSKNSFEYLQIDLGELKVITMIETQGRFGNGQGQEFTDQYMVNYQREDGGSWFLYRSNRGQELFQGNANPYSTELRDVIPAIIAKRIRVIPYSTHPKHVCLGIELYGCTWTDGSVSYEMRQGDRRGSDIDLFDYAYDGVVLQNYLSGGLGQLTDGDEGPSNFRLDPRNLGKRGYEWIGWRSDTFAGGGGDGPAVEMTFRFDAVRNFSLLQIHANNLFTRDVRIFRAARVSFSVDGQQFAAAADVEFALLHRRESLQSEAARTVDVPLMHRVGRFVKVRLFFDSKWMLISEVHFESERLTSNASEDLSMNAASATDSNSINRTKNNISTVPLRLPANGFLITSTADYVETADRRHLNDKYIGIIIVVLSGLTLVLLAVLVLVFVRHRKYTCMPLPYALPKVTKTVVTGRESSSPPTTLNKGPRPFDASSLHHHHHQQQQQQQHQEPVYDNISSQDQWTLDGRSSNSAGSSSGASVAAAATAATTTTTMTSSSVTLLSRLFVREFGGISTPEGQTAALVQPMVVSPSQLVLVEKLGESRFGEVHLSRVYAKQKSDQSFGAPSTLRSESRSVLAIVRWLKNSADDQTKAEFSRELKKILSLKHVNVSQAIGYCASASAAAAAAAAAAEGGPSGSSWGVLLEAGEFGDLKTFLQQHCAESGASTTRRDAKLLSYGTLVYFATQIASGMRHLELLNVAHCDLATRNCLVGSQFVVKVADLGRSWSRHRMDYSSLQGYAGLPLRWMSWEAVVMGKFSTRSDVWSFAVTVWEILTLGRRWPLDSLSDRQVVENCNHYYMADGLEVSLDQPALCTREVYDLLLECCHRSESQRPSFREIHMFLQRKNMGYYYRPDDGDRTENS